MRCARFSGMCRKSTESAEPLGQLIKTGKNRLIMNKKSCFSDFLLWFAISQIFPHFPLDRRDGKDRYFFGKTKKMAITYEFTPAANRKRKTLRVPAEAPAKAGVGQACKRGFAASNATGSDANASANPIRCRMVCNYQFFPIFALINVYPLWKSSSVSITSTMRRSTNFPKPTAD